jgi:ribosomal-protein-alanine N-acetyltransferase
MMPRLTIERLTHDDVPDVMAVDHLSFPTPWSENAYRSELGNVSAYYLVARLDHRLVGYAGAWMVMDEMHITTIGVHPDFRRSGIGDRLFAALLREAVSRGVRRASLEVRESNQAAQSLYSKYGFVPIARRRGYYSDTGEDAIVMWVENLQSAVSPTLDSRHPNARTPERLNA